MVGSVLGVRSSAPRDREAETETTKLDNYRPPTERPTHPGCATPLAGKPLGRPQDPCRARTDRDTWITAKSASNRTRRRCARPRDRRPAGRRREIHARLAPSTAAGHGRRTLAPSAEARWCRTHAGPSTRESHPGEQGGRVRPPTWPRRPNRPPVPLERRTIGKNGRGPAGRCPEAHPRAAAGNHLEREPVHGRCSQVEANRPDHAPVRPKAGKSRFESGRLAQRRPWCNGSTPTRLPTRPGAPRPRTRGRATSRRAEGLARLPDEKGLFPGRHRGCGRPGNLSGATARRWRHADPVGVHTARDRPDNSPALPAGAWVSTNGRGRPACHPRRRADADGWEPHPGALVNAGSCVASAVTVG